MNKLEDLRSLDGESRKITNNIPYSHFLLLPMGILHCIKKQYHVWHSHQWWGCTFIKRNHKSRNKEQQRSPYNSFTYVYILEHFYHVHDFINSWQDILLLWYHYQIWKRVSQSVSMKKNWSEKLNRDLFRPCHVDPSDIFRDKWWATFSWFYQVLIGHSFLSLTNFDETIRTDNVQVL